MPIFLKNLSILALSHFILTGCHENSKEMVDLIIQNGNIINLETGKIEQKDIYITNGRIKELGNSDASPLYNGNKHINAKGKYILPGFWDNHVHFRGAKT